MKKILSTFLVLCLFLIINAQDYHVRFGFLGNSITIGYGLNNPTQDCYPSQLAKLLKEKYGDTCIISNYAVSGRTMLKQGDAPLWNEASFQKGWQEAPDICFILLGTNDTKWYNWDYHGNEFHADYLAMMDTFMFRNPYVKYIICYPPPAYAVVWDIRNEIIVDEVIPIIDTILTEREAVLVDFYNPLLDSVHLFPDKIHPNPQGAGVMAKIAFDKIVESDIIHNVTTNVAFAMDLHSNTKELRQGDSATISWVSRNGYEVKLNDVAVDSIGSMKIAPEFTTDYTLQVLGTLSNDELTITQQVYVPELNKITFSPNRITMEEGESIDFSIKYYDQKKKVIDDKTYPATWEIIEGEGTLENTTNTSVTFVATATGKSKLQITANEVVATVSITVNEPTGIPIDKNMFQSYPNPCNNEFIIPVGNNENILEINVFESNGKLVMKLSSNEIIVDKENIKIDTKNLNKGIYLFNVKYTNKTLSGKLVRK